jgi:hypothetical protein
MGAPTINMAAFCACSILTAFFIIAGLLPLAICSMRPRDPEFCMDSCGNPKHSISFVIFLGAVTALAWLATAFYSGLI